jgi:hypothetical protein
MDSVETVIEEYVRTYVMPRGDEIYVPTDDEAALLADAIKGLVAQPEFMAAYAARPLRVPVPKGLTNEEIFAIRDRHLGDDSGSFDCIAFARDLLGAAMKREQQEPREPTDAQLNALWQRFETADGGRPDHRGFARAVLDAAHR